MDSSGPTPGNANPNPAPRRTLARRLLALAGLALAAVALPACQVPYSTGDAIKGFNQDLNYGLFEHLEALDIDPGEARKSGVKLTCPDLAYEGKPFSCTLTGKHIEKAQVKMRVDDKGEIDFAGDADLKAAAVGALNEEMSAAMPALLETSGAGPAVAGNAGVSIECPGKIEPPAPACILSGRLSGRSAAAKVKLKGVALDFANERESAALGEMLAAEVTAAQRVTERAQ